MGMPSSSFLFGFSLLLILGQKTVFASTKPRPYVVYMGEHSHGPQATLVDYNRATDSHHSLLGSYLGSIEKSREAVFYSYTKHINGFAAILDEEQAEAIAQHPDVISVFPDQKKKLHTTKTWAFMGLEQPDGTISDDSIWTKARFGEDTIIANLDTGVWPDSESFNDAGMGPVPARWKGTCQSDDLTGRVPCNRKLIGVRAFFKGYESAWRPFNATERLPHDVEGHGSHTLSTAGGVFVPNANIYGYARGTAKGGSPRARVASYKICWSLPGIEGGCYDSDILAAFDQAIHDGVDVISNSYGGGPEDFFQSGSNIGSFHAVKKGISVAFSAGNDGPSPATVTNVSPWIFTVGASSIDRSYLTVVKLGNERILLGQSVLDMRMQQKYHPLIDSVDAKLDSANATAAHLCSVGSLDPKKVKGKVVVCYRGGNIARVEKGMAVKLAGGVATILVNDELSGDSVDPDAHVLPAAHITYSDGHVLQSYINSTKSPVAYLVPLGTTLAPEASPSMAAFTSRGPSSLLPEILKPDITAPGVSVLAAYTGLNSPTELPQDKRRVSFNIMSGTSMSCPHVAGIMGLLKTLHPDWSPAAIRSAIMTTARSRDNAMEPMLDSSLEKATPFDYGAGHIRPNRAQDPGLVYDISTNDYLDFLCSWGFNSSQMEIFSMGYKCPHKEWSILDLNYPSITVLNLNESTTVTRRLKNVGTPGTYKVTVEHLNGVSASVEPSSLTFQKMGEEKSYKLTLSPKYRKMGGDYLFGRIVWSDGVHYVRSPIVVS